jgi:purine-binding chemotaxis protein CheW
MNSEIDGNGITVEENSGDVTQLITFTLGNEEYGVDIMAVREIKVWSKTTPLPNTPESVMGVINIRGVILPIFDLRHRFYGVRTDPTSTHVVIVVAVDERTVGILVDTVSDIVSVKSAEVRAVPETNTKGSAYLGGLVTVGDRMVALIKPEKLFEHDTVDEQVAA